jgi:preprotein translocase subunit SecA
MYKKLAGMTGTAMTEAAEFEKIYKLDVVEIPTNKPMIRIDHMDIVYRTEQEKFRNAAKEIKEKHEKGQPVLVGTISIEKSERLSAILKRMGVRHEVLNAKNHEREAFIIAQAGRKGAVTVSTNMAGRGTDILLGGNPEYMAREHFRKQGLDPDSVPKEEYERVFREYKAKTDREHDEVVALGGLHIVGTERHESRRIDNQLRGRAGRQGDPGSSRFYLSLEDDLMRIFGGERIKGLMLRLGMEEDVPIESKLITKRIAAAQKAVEAQNFAARKHLLEYDDVMDKQRKAIYALRRSLLEGTDQKETILGYVKGILTSFLDARCPAEEPPHTWDIRGLQSDILTQFGVTINVAEVGEMSRPEMEESIYALLVKRYQEKEDLVGLEIMRETERIIMLNVIDNQWKDHLLQMDHLKEGIGLRGYGQKDPLVEYKKESFALYEAMRDRIEDEICRYLFFLSVADAHAPARHLEPEPDEDEVTVAAALPDRRAAQHAFEDLTRSIHRKKERELAQVSNAGSSTAVRQPVVKGKQPGRNEPCPCGSGKKYKKCCGA